MVSRPLTPPYVPFGIRRFLSLRRDRFVIRSEELVTGPFQSFIGERCVEYRAAGNPPVAFSRVGEDSCVAVTYPQILKVSPSRSYFFPTFPDNRPDSSAHPFVDTGQPTRYIGQFVIVRPASHEALQLAFPLFIALHVPSAGKLFDFRLHFPFRLCVQSGTKPFPAFVESISRKFYLSGIGYYCFLRIYLKKVRP